VVNTWRADANADEPVSARLAQGARRLGIDENTIVLLGGADLNYGIVDLKLPALPPAELQNALSFALVKHAPISTEKLVWGYRIVRDRKQDGLDVRLVYMRDSEWGKWLEECSGFGRGIDLILPPAAALDPVLTGHDVYVSSARNGSVCFRAKPDGTREPAARVGDDGFGVGESPISLSGLDIGTQLTRMPAEEQREFVPALLLSMHGVGHSLASDKRTWVPVPYQLRPQRNRYSRFLAALLVLALVGVASLFVAREYAAANSHYMDLKKQCADLETQTTELKKEGDPSETIKALAEELAEVRVERPSLGAALIELTQLTSDALWVKYFNWTDGKIEIEFSTEDEQADIRTKIESSPIFDGVMLNRKSIDAHGVTSVRLTMFVGYTGDYRMPPTASSPPPVRDDSEPVDESEDEVPPEPDVEQPDEVPIEDGTEEAGGPIEEGDVEGGVGAVDGDEGVPDESADEEGSPATHMLQPPPPPPPLDPKILEALRNRGRIKPKPDTADAVDPDEE